MTLTPLRLQFLKYAVTHSFLSPNNLSASAFEDESRLNVSQCKQQIHENRMRVYMFMHTCYYCRFSSHFSTRGSQVRCELANYASKFGTSQQSSQVHFNV